MKKNLAALAIPLFFSIGMTAGPALADGHSNRLFIDRDVDTFAVLPDGVRFPEGITANPANGDIYVGTFDGGNQNKLLRYNRHGRLVASRDFGITPLLGLEFDRANKKVYITSIGDFVGGASKIQRVAADLSQLEDVAVIPPTGAPAPRVARDPDSPPAGQLERRRPGLLTLRTSNSAEAQRWGRERRAQPTTSRGAASLSR